MLTDMTVKDFVRELASSSPAPGGGSTSALAGALGAALVSMVAGLTAGRKEFEENEKAVREMLGKSGVLVESLIRLVDDDAQAYRRVVAGYRMPKDTGEGKEKRSAVIQEALKQAALVPLETARQCLAVMELASAALDLGNPNVRSDAAVSLWLACAGLRGALLNVSVNLESIKDECFKREADREKDVIAEKARSIYENAPFVRG
ncbi:MAG TPA: cyclodeaminase/cyclohydrolase family protein [Bacillota bacterium]|nr:cyclodeaminase/cyclohydrolase family protein [Bacillota bacterium]